MLEVIDKGSGNAGPTLLFIHGAWHGAWCWDEHFLDFFAESGFRAVALSLRGHGNSPADKRLNLCSIADYLDDVISVAESSEAPPVVIGHSLGGLIVQKYLQTQRAPAGILLASAPPNGLGAATIRLSRALSLSDHQVRATRRHHDAAEHAGAVPGVDVLTGHARTPCDGVLAPVPAGK